MSNIIELKNISRTYSNQAKTLTVLDDITLTIAEGEMVAITGASGSGKSTLMNIMGCLDVASSGAYFIFGQNAAELSQDELARLRREHIGFIFQRYHLLPDTTALGNVEMPAIYANSKRSERRERAKQLLAQLGLAGREHHKPGELSGGEQQRVCIARALINGAEVILADEPTGALDSKSGREVLQILTELHQEGHTVVIVTHDKEIAQYAQRTIELKDGGIIADSGRRGGAGNSECVHSACGTGFPCKGSFLAFCPPYLKMVGQAHPTYLGSLLDRIHESLHLALKTMNAHRLRTTLTMVGIIFGIAAVVTVVALGEGAKQRTLEDIKGLGTNVVSIYSGRDYFDADVNVRPLALSDVQALNTLSFVDSVSPEVFIMQPIRFQGKSGNALIYGVGRDYFYVEGIHFIEGNNFSDDRSALQEVVIDEKARKTFFGDGNSPLGQTIFLGSVPARVVGVAHDNRNYSPNQLSAWVPYTTAMYRVLGQQNLSSIVVRLKENVSNDAAVNAINQLLTQRHGVKDFKLFNRDQIRQSMEHTSRTLSLLVLLVASISLMIGSLGVMNIMLVSVTERTHEIGVRVAVGARRSDILQQFLIEAILVCLTGGVVGIALSLAIGPLLSSLGSDVLVAIYSWRTAAAAFFCSTLIGVLFGYLPARKAARMDPVVALASE